MTEYVAGLDASQLQRLGVYYQDNYWNGPSPSAVLLDIADDVAFEGDPRWSRWSRAQEESAPRLLSQALRAGFMATELRDADGNLLGYLVATEQWYGERRNRYQLVASDDGKSYDIPTSQQYRSAESIM